LGWRRSGHWLSSADHHDKVEDSGEPEAEAASIKQKSDDHLRFDFATDLFTAAFPARTARSSEPVCSRTELAACANARLDFADFAFFVCRVASAGVQGISLFLQKRA
jgi:hypothetical protein